jgi:hypothetical protein
LREQMAELEEKEEMIEIDILDQVERRGRGDHREYWFCNVKDLENHRKIIARKAEVAVAKMDGEVEKVTGEEDQATRDEDNADTFGIWDSAHCLLHCLATQTANSR